MTGSLRRPAVPRCRLPQDLAPQLTPMSPAAHCAAAPGASRRPQPRADAPVARRCQGPGEYHEGDGTGWAATARGDRAVCVTEEHPMMTFFVSRRKSLLLGLGALIFILGLYSICQYYWVIPNQHI